MPASEAQLRANQANALRSTGPRTEEGKERSRRNACKHGLAGAGLVLPEADAAAVDDRFDLLSADLRPRSPAGVILVRAMAVCSVRMDRASRQETYAVAKRVRDAIDDFDEARVDAADLLFDSLGENPRTNLRRLRTSPEGIDRLLAAWQDLRDGLARMPRPAWTAEQLERAGLMLGLDAEKARWSRLGVLSRGIWGDETAYDAGEADADAQTLREWGRSGLLRVIDAEIEALEGRYEKLDLGRIELDRREAPGRALFDPSRGATLARRYEASAARGFFKALEEFRRVEAEAADRAELGPPGPASSRRPGSGSGPIRQPAPPAWSEPIPAFEAGPLAAQGVARGADGASLTVGRPPGSRL